MGKFRDTVFALNQSNFYQKVIKPIATWASKLVYGLFGKTPPPQS